MDIISVVLGADTKKDRTKDSIKIIEYAFSNYKMIDIAYIVHDEFDTIVENSEFNIKKGINNVVKLELSKNDINFYPVNKEDIKDIKCETRLDTDLEAPVYERDKIGKITVKIDEEIIYEVDIITKNDVRKKGVVDYFTEVGQKFFRNNLEVWLEATH